MVFHTSRTFVDSSAPPWGDTDDGAGTTFRPGDRWVDDRDGGVFTYLSAASGEWQQTGDGVYTLASDQTRTSTSPLTLFSLPMVSGRAYRVEWQILSSGTTTAIPGMQFNWPGSGESGCTGIMTSADDADAVAMNFLDAVTNSAPQYPTAGTTYLFHGHTLVQASASGSMLIRVTEHGTGTATFYAGSKAYLRDVGAAL